MVRILFFLVFSITVSIAQPVGIQLYSLRDHLPKDYRGNLARIAAWGITELEGGGTNGMPAPEYRQMLAGYGLKMIAIGADYGDLEKNVPKVIAAAREMQVNYVVCYWIPHPDGPLSIEDARRAIAVFASAGKTLAENGITLCYHPHGYEFSSYGSGTVFDEMMRSLDPKHMSFEMDVFWVKQGGVDPLTLMRKHPGRFPLVHLKDRRTGTSDSADGHADVETNVVLGTGDVGIGDILKEATRLGVKHFFIEDESSRVLQQVPESVKFIRKYLK